MSGADFCLNGDDGSDGALPPAAPGPGALWPRCGVWTTSLEELYDRLEAVYSEVYDLADTVRDKRDGFRLLSRRSWTQVEGRLDQLYRLKKKYGPTVEEMLDYLDQLPPGSWTHIRGRRRHPAAPGKAAEKKARKAARRRRRACPRPAIRRPQRLEEQILTELRQLDMGKIRFAIDFAGAGAWCGAGMDQVRFLMSANVGEELRPIHKIASGGELARIMLAMKNVLSEQDQVGTMVFDEVDTGVSGRAAQKVAEKMARISRTKQVLCVTHLPQLAAMADTHFSVEKGEQRGPYLYPGACGWTVPSAGRSWPVSPAAASISRHHAGGGRGAAGPRRRNSRKPWPGTRLTNRGRYTL